jgi:Transglutaminase-like superfamily
MKLLLDTHKQPDLRCCLMHRVGTSTVVDATVTLGPGVATDKAGRGTGGDHYRNGRRHPRPRRLLSRALCLLYYVSFVCGITATRSRAHFVQLSVEMAAFVIPRAARGDCAPGRPCPSHHRQLKQYPNLPSQPHQLSRGGGGVGGYPSQRIHAKTDPARSSASSSSISSYSVQMSATKSTKLGYDHAATTTQQHHHHHRLGSTSSQFVASIKNPLFSLWRRFRNSSNEASGLSASSTQEQEKDLVVVAAESESTADWGYPSQNMNLGNGRSEYSNKDTVTIPQQIHLSTTTTTTPEQNERQESPAKEASTAGTTTTTAAEEEGASTTTTTPPTEGKKRSAILELTFTDPTNKGNEKKTYKALNTCRRKFEAYLNYLGANSTTIHSSQITTEHIDMNHPNLGDKRDEWRDLWKARRLLTDRTEFLAVYQSDKQDGEDSKGNKKEQGATTRRGGFVDLLHLYTERLLGILKDEEEDQGTNGSASAVLGVRTWLEENYGQELTHGLMASQFQQLTEEEQLARLQHFADWFRSIMPYYYDKCGSCSASFKEESAAAVAAQQQPKQDEADVSDGKNNTMDGSSDDEATCLDDDGDKEDEVDEDDDQGTFLGYIYPSEQELVGKASRTELYQCHKCHAFTRFPRFNSAHAIIEHRRGRCGEYSTLIYRFLRALDLEARWVVDWADHVWAEVLLEGRSKKNGRLAKPRWVHFDPCEAAVDNPHLYQGWGKKQTFVIGLYSPPRSGAGKKKLAVPVVEDLTHRYTTDGIAKIASRRDESQEEVKRAIDQAISRLEVKLGMQEATEEYPSRK